jgi:hypothetical protein
MVEQNATKRSKQMTSRGVIEQGQIEQMLMSRLMLQSWEIG